MTTYSYQGNKRYWQPRPETTVTDEQPDEFVHTGYESSDHEELRDSKEKIWDLRNVMNLLRYYAAHRCLWDVRDVNNRNRKLRRAALVDIAAAISDNLTTQEVVRKINVLRATYRYEKRRIKKRMRKGLGARTKLKWFALADQFLRNIPRSKKSHRKGSETDSDLDDSIVFKVEPDTIMPCEQVEQQHEDKFVELLKFLEQHSEVLLENSSPEALEDLAKDMQKPILEVAELVLQFRCLYNTEILKQKLVNTYKPSLSWWPLAEKIMLSRQELKVEQGLDTDNFIDINELPPMTPAPAHSELTTTSLPDANTQLVWNGLEDNLLEGKWSLKYSIKFLRLYGAHRCLWDLNDPEYRSRELRAAAIEDIASAMGHGLTADFVTKKIKIFRITYMQHRKRMLAAQKQGKEPKIQLLWFPLADSFLRKHVGLRAIGATEPEIPQFDYQDVVTNLNLIDPGLLTQFEGKGTQNTIEIGLNSTSVGS